MGMGQYDDKENFWLMLFIFVCFGLLIFFGRVTEEDVRACENQTGWSAARCQMELSR